MYNLRKVTKDDIKLLFDWANDPDARANAKNSDLIKWEDHIKWFDGKMANSLSFVYILENNKENKDIGVVRFDKNDNNFVISYFIDPSYRGQGLGRLILEEGFKKLESIVKNPELLAYVKKGNIASEKTFEKLEFNLDREEKISNINFNIYKKIK